MDFVHYARDGFETDKTMRVPNSHELENTLPVDSPSFRSRVLPESTMQCINHTHRYASYLLDLRSHWAYANVQRVPGRTRPEKEAVEAKR